jgi:DNA-binding NarL/FixJ family response regulator
MEGSQRDKAKMLKTLIVEDSAIFRVLLKETLQSRFPSMEISEATSGHEALQKVEALSPDLIFMDIKLPEESGLELTTKIKTEHPNITVIMLTSYDTPEYREAASQARADFFLAKGSSTKTGILELVESIVSAQ